MDRIRLPAGQVNRVNTHTHTATTLIKYYKGTVNFFFCCLVVEDLQPRRGMNGSENFKKIKKKSKNKKKKKRVQDIRTRS